MLMHSHARRVAQVCLPHVCACRPTWRCIWIRDSEQSAYVSTPQRTELMLANAMGTATVLFARADLRSPALVWSGELGAKYDGSICPRPRKLRRPDAGSQSPRLRKATAGALQIVRQGQTRWHAAPLLKACVV